MEIFGSARRMFALWSQRTFRHGSFASPIGHEQSQADGRFEASQLTNGALLLQRVFDIDMQHRPNCGGELMIIAAILEQPVIEKVLTHLGLQSRAPPRAAERGQSLQAA